MLESIVKMLAQGSRPSKLDAYVTLLKTMQAFNEVPDIQSLQAKMGLLTQFIQRDIQASSPTGKGLDSQLCSQALKLLIALIRIPDVRSAMDDEFCSFMLDRSIQVAGADADVPKTIINSHLALLMKQNFRPTCMTPLRVERILQVLQDIEQRVSGYSVQAYRLHVYKKLVQQQPKVMKAHLESWFKLTVTSTLALHNELNQSALDLAQLAGRVIGHDRVVTKAVLAIFNRKISDGPDDGTTFGKTFCQQLTRLLDNSQTSVLVPQIWGALTPFFRGSFVAEKFTNLDNWLKIFEKMFKSDNVEVKVRANAAFVSMVYAVNITHLTPPSWTKFLLKIPEEQLQRRNQFTKLQADSATAAYYALLYYSLRQTAHDSAEKELSRYWTEYVAEFWQRLIHHSPKNSAAACRVAAALFAGSRRPWNELRVFDLKHHPLVQREELPTLSPTWVRKNIGTVLKFVETCLDTAPWTAEATDDEPSKAMWIALIDSLVEASSKEVVTSGETKDAVAQIINLLRRIWYQHTSTPAMQQQKENNWADKFCFIIEIVLQKMGPTLFVDKFLMRTTDDEFQVAPTPSHRSRQHGPRLSPLLYFIDLVVNQSEEKLSDPIRLRVLKLLIEPCLISKRTRSLKLELLKDCVATIDSSIKSTVTSTLSQRLTLLAQSCIEESADSANQSSGQLGKDYEAVVQILSLGAPYISNSADGRDLLTSLIELVKREPGGDGALVLAVIERMANVIQNGLWNHNSWAAMSYASALLENLPKAVTRRALEVGRKALWSASSAPSKSSDFDTYHHFYAAIKLVASSAYQQMETQDMHALKRFLTALTHSIKTCNISHLGLYLRKIQDSVTIWVEDSERKLQSGSASVKEVYDEVENLWRAASEAIRKLPKKDSAMLVALEPLITSGFVTRRRRLVNISVESWNDSFGKLDNLRYPSRLELVLQRLAKLVHLSLPSLQRHESDLDDQISFYDSEADTRDLAETIQSPNVRDTPFRRHRLLRHTRSSASSTPSSKRTSARQSGKVRLRHDNSQIHFEPIDSSPTHLDEQESQILTERQREMIEKQRATANMFVGISSSTLVEPQLPKQAVVMPELHSDMPNTDEGDEISRTPLKTVPSSSPMDVYLGSSPTPHSHSRSQQILSDDTEVMTPTAVRSVRLVEDNDEPCSSPPHLPQVAQTSVGEALTTGEVFIDSFENRQPDISSGLFDSETGNDLNSSEAVHGSPVVKRDESDIDLPSDIDFSDLPSSTVDLQLTAQISAEMNGQKAESETVRPKTEPEANPLPIGSFADGDVAGTTNHAPDLSKREVIQAAQSGNPVLDDSAAGSLDSSRVTDSFSQPSVANFSSPSIGSQLQKLRRGSRGSVATPTRQSGRNKRKQPPVGSASKAKRVRNDKPKSASQPSAPSATRRVEDDLSDCIVVAVRSSPYIRPSVAPKKTLSTPGSGKMSDENMSSPKAPSTGRKPGRPRKRPLDEQAEEDTSVAKRVTRRSVFNLGQVEISEQDTTMEDTAAPKPARTSGGDDVSLAIAVLSEDPASSQVKRLSHVQVTPKKRRSSRAPDEAREEDVAGGVETEQVQSQEEPNSTGSSESSTESGLSHLRRILTPSSIMARIRNMIPAIKHMKLKKQEERELDDLMFEFRTEVHAAGRRGEVAEQGHAASK